MKSDSSPLYYSPASDSSATPAPITPLSAPVPVALMPFTTRYLIRKKISPVIIQYVPRDSFLSARIDLVHKLDFCANAIIDEDLEGYHQFINQADAYWAVREKLQTYRLYNASAELMLDDDYEEKSRQAVGFTVYKVWIADSHIVAYLGTATTFTLEPPLLHGGIKTRDGVLPVNQNQLIALSNEESIKFEWLSNQSIAITFTQQNVRQLTNLNTVSKAFAGINADCATSKRILIKGLLESYVDRCVTNFFGLFRHHAAKAHELLQLIASESDENAVLIALRQQLQTIHKLQQEKGQYFYVGCHFLERVDALNLERHLLTSAQPGFEP